MIKLLPHSFVVNEFIERLKTIKPFYFHPENTYAINFRKREYYINEDEIIFMLDYFKEDISVKYIIDNILHSYTARDFDDAENFMLTFKIN